MKQTTIFILMLSGCCYLHLKSVEAKPPTPACTFPNLEPWTDEIRYFVKTPNEPNCSAQLPVLFRSNVTHLKPEPISTFQINKIKSCCYRKIQGQLEYSDVKFVGDCHNLSFTTPTRVPHELGNEFVAIECFKEGEDRHFVMDFHTFPMESVMRYLNETRGNFKIKPENKVNVVVLVFNGVTHMNFQRMMPRSYKFLMNSLSALEMKGHTRLGYNTSKNLIPMWTGKFYDEFVNSCVPPGSNRTIDDCHFVWNNFSEAGFMTGYHDDFYNSLFPKPFYGFKKPPMHFYGRPLTNAFNDWLAKEKLKYFSQCAGPKTWFRTLMETAQKVLATTEHMPFPFFYMSFISAVGHDDLPHLQFGDPPLLAFLMWFRLTSYVNNTVLILIADRGIEEGELQFTERGVQESNSPMFYIALPPAFKNKYKRAFQNLQGNQDRLVTHFDVYETLGNLAQLDNLEDEEIIRREGQLEKAPRLLRGINLFLPIPLTRTCDLAGIEPDWCPCVHLTQKSLIPIYPAFVRAVPKRIVEIINEKINLTMGKCSQLGVRKLLYAYQDSYNHFTKKYYIFGVETQPGGGQYEAIVLNFGDDYKVVPYRIYRINAIDKNTSYCKKETPEEKLCYCLELYYLEPPRNQEQGFWYSFYRMFVAD